MAFQATHLRFALDLKEEYRVQNLQQYLVGTLYPDSRYLTKIDRGITHPKDYMHWNIEQIDDFQKGWLIHLRCDEIQRTIQTEYVPSASEGDTRQGGEVWIKRTALKLLQDLDDVRRFDISSILPLLEYAENRNREDIKLLRQYNQIFPRIYTEPLEMDIKSYGEMWTAFGIEAKLSEQVEQQALAYEQNSDIRSSIPNIYPEMLVRARLANI